MEISKTHVDVLRRAAGQAVTFDEGADLVTVYAEMVGSNMLAKETSEDGEGTQVYVITEVGHQILASHSTPPAPAPALRPNIRATHTFATLKISEAAYDEIAGLLKTAQYDHAFVDIDDDGIALDMHGIGLIK